MSVVVEEAVPGAEPVPRGRSPWRLAWARFAHNRAALASVVCSC